MFMASAYAKPDGGRVGARDRRRFERYRCGLGTPRCLSAALAVHPWVVPVQDVSAGGVQLTLSDRLDSGTLVPLKLFNRSRLFECTISARAVYSRKDPDEGFRIGLAFTRVLSEPERDGLLNSSAANCDQPVAPG
jgi:hypothetical protein